MSGQPQPRNAKEPERPKFQVIRAFGDYKAGDVIEEGPDWPFHRAAQLTRQRYLMPLDQKPDAPRRAVA